MLNELLHTKYFHGGGSGDCGSGGDAVKQSVWSSLGDNTTAHGGIAAILYDWAHTVDPVEVTGDLEASTFPVPLLPQGVEGESLKGTNTRKITITKNGGESREFSQSFPKKNLEREGDEGSGRGAGTLKEDAGGNHGTACSTISKDLTAFGAKSRRASNSSRLVSTSKDRLDTERKLPLMKVDDLTTISIMARISGSPGACSRGRRMWSSKGLSRGAVTKSYI
jgi:hypothetical protein